MIRVEQQSRVIGFVQLRHMNYLYHLICPDGLLLAFYAGYWDGAVGFVGSSVRHLSQALADDNSLYKHLVESVEITSNVRKQWRTYQVYCTATDNNLSTILSK